MMYFEFSVTVTFIEILLACFAILKTIIYNIILFLHRTLLCLLPNIIKQESCTTSSWPQRGRRELHTAARLPPVKFDYIR